MLNSDLSKGDRGTFLVLAAVVTAGLALTGTGLLSFAGGPDFDIDGRECEALGEKKFSCPVETDYQGTGAEFARDTIYLGEAESFLLSRNGAGEFLQSEDVLTEGNEFNQSAWSGECALEGEFSDGSGSVTVSKSGELSSQVGLGCRADSTTVSELGVESCSEGLIGADEDACRGIAANSSGASLNVVYDLSSESDSGRSSGLGIWSPVLDVVSFVPFLSVG